jgi:hypothetical protein
MYEPWTRSKPLNFLEEPERDKPMPVAENDASNVIHEDIMHSLVMLRPHSWWKRDR